MSSLRFQLQEQVTVTVTRVCIYILIWSRGSSVSIVSECGLDDRDSIRSRGKRFSSSLCVEPGSESSCPMVTGVSFPGAKTRPECDADHSPPSSAEVKNEQALPQAPPLRVVGQL
jgi:hypothetical protein